MSRRNQTDHLRHLLGRKVMALKKDGTKITGKLVKIKGNRAYIKTGKVGKNKARVKALVPLLLYDLLAIGQPGVAGPYPYGGFGYGPGYGPPYYGGAGYTKPYPGYPGYPGTGGYPGPPWAGPGGGWFL